MPMEISRSGFAGGALALGVAVWPRFAAAIATDAHGWQDRIVDWIGSIGS